MKQDDAVGRTALAGPLDGIRVLDLTSVVLGPMATQILGDLGADVIKIEGPEGDLMRSNGVSRHPGLSSIYLALNRNKRSVVLDLKTEGGKAGLRALIADADVLVHNMRVSAIERLGFGYAAAAAINPRLVYCVATGFGQDGPDRDKPAFDDIIQAACGLVGLLTPEGQRPEYVPSLIADKTVGMALANAVLAALLHRERRGEGQQVEVPMLETMASFVMAEHLGGLTFEPPAGGAGYARLLQGGRRPAKTRDGWICALPYTDRHWRAFFESAGRGHVLEQIDISDRAQRNANIRMLYAQMAEITLERTTAEWLALFAELDIPATPILALDDVPRHPHLAAVGLFQETTHPTAGPLREMRPAARFSATPLSLRRHAPTLGEHTDEVLSEAGFKAPQ
ncbi:CaiB/BaiF CoA transferase family protein [Cupriavidus plantarum]|uniref:CaiB/BaiF CoA transferase family protein n=1 Tax=Cupriavidus plantarum TaxID=942865 RepID=UPI001B26F5F7|nr:CoA transferase [Cupriavidus plantarum]CAG2138416.1 putative fatty acyl-CoA transferase [Cupriavidus plantarum]SMR85878.1 formyl-CoA transferase [Cupriavidus plantarum]